MAISNWWAERMLWMLLGIWVVAGLIAGAACASTALSSGCAPAPWFAAGLAFNAIALAVLLIRPRGARERTGSAQERTGSAQERPTFTQERPTFTQERPTSTQDRTASSNGRTEC